jgi:hypothetical protein
LIDGYVLSTFGLTSIAAFFNGFMRHALLNRPRSEKMKPLGQGFAGVSRIGPMLAFHLIVIFQT